MHRLHILKKNQLGSNNFSTYKNVVQPTDQPVKSFVFVTVNLLDYHE